MPDKKIHSKTFRFSLAWPVLASLAVAMLHGCGNSEVELANVQGTVTMDGRPLAEATICFVPMPSGRNALGRTDAQGQYKMLYSATASGAIVGPVRVEITTGNPDNPKQFPETVPARYNVRSELRAEVGPRSNTLDFQLKSVH